MPEVVLAHDYLVQVGGAERVVAEWAAGFGSHTVVTLAYRREATFDEFRHVERGDADSVVTRTSPLSLE